MDGPTALNVLTLSTEQTPHSGAGDDPHLSDLNARARRAIEAEHSSSISSAFFKHPWACFWSLAMTMCVVMFGYDTTLVNSFYAYPSFIEKFGVYDEKTGAKAITTHWMTSINVSLSCGELVGLWCSGFFMERYGHRRVLIFSFILLCAFIFLEFFAQSLAMLLVAEFLMAFPWGIFTVLGTAYSSEVCPLRLRGYMTSFTQIAATIGQLIGSGVLLGSVNNLSTWSWRIPFAVQWAWPVPLAILAFFAPESPWWLVRRNRIDDARASVKRLSQASDEEREDSIGLMIHTDAYERALKTQGSYWDCFKGTNLRRTEIVCMLFISPGWCGEQFAYQPTYFFVQAGLGSKAAFQLNMGSTAISFACIFVTWWLMGFVGRRTLTIFGIAGMWVCLVVVGGLAFLQTKASLWIAGAFVLLWIVFLSLSIGPITYTVAGEVTATRLRNQTLGIGRASYVVINIIDKIVEPQLINPTSLNLKGKTALFWFGTTTIVLLWAIFRLPETRNRSFEELDILFERKIPAWKFAAAKVDLAESNEQVAQVEGSRLEEEKAVVQDEQMETV